jgi:hypothetical protein
MVKNKSWREWSGFKVIDVNLKTLTHSMNSAKPPIRGFVKTHRYVILYICTVQDRRMTLTDTVL